MKKLFLSIFCFGLFFCVASKAEAADLQSGDLIKASLPAVYYYATDGKRYVFPNEKTYNTWYDGFTGVKTITDSELAVIQIGGNAVYRAGVKLIKIQTDPKVYAVAKDGVLRWIKTESIAVALYGADWAKKVEDVPDAFFTNYTIGADIGSADNYNPTAEKTSDTEPITTGVAPVEPVQVVPVATYKWNIKEVNSDLYLHKNPKLSAFNGGFTALWNDDRHGQSEVLYQKVNNTITLEGVVQRVSSNLTTSDNAVSVYNGSILYILWEDSSIYKRAIYLQKRDSVGNTLSDGLFTSSSIGSARYPDIGSGEDDIYGIVWWDTKTSSDSSRGKIIFKRMENGLKVGEELRLGEETIDAHPRIISAGDNFGVIWQEETNKIKFAIVDKNASLVGAEKEVCTASGATKASIAFSGETFGATWEDNGTIYYILLDNQGNIIGLPQTVALGSGSDIAWTGEKFYISYTAGTDIKIAKISKIGNVEEININVSNSVVASTNSSLAVNGGVVSILWLEKNGSYDKLLGAVESKE
ncbi:MAG: hypothetical protein COU51_02340 [Parcubacteria group bacterium CG10_big_fil_rev_8_21_14_0_10_36_14]|nr:MAG: hypothetical protein COU51_02340 [Parcubacteria group bacterium CG10_big_fil_rev_8_21_14_0_10_36_14]